MKKAIFAFARFIQVIALVLVVVGSRGNLLIIGSAILFGLGAFAEGLTAQKIKSEVRNDA